MQSRVPHNLNTTSSRCYVELSLECGRSPFRVSEQMRERGEDGGGRGWGWGGGMKVVQAVVITHTSSAEPRHTGPHCMRAMGCDKAAQESKVRFFKHKFSGHAAPTRTGHTGNLNKPLSPTEGGGGGN